LAVDPLQQGRELAAQRLADTHVAVDFAGVDGQSIALDDDAVDAALSTWTLCSIADPIAAVREVARVLRPDGAFHFVEHGRSPDNKVRVWQDRLNGLQRRLACGCNLNRDIPAIIEGGGFTITELETFYAKGDPKLVAWTFRGTARVSTGGAA
jgi:SAM-dependent methyltransferase